MFPMSVAGKQVDGPETFEIRSPYDDELVATTSWASPDQVEEAVAAAHALRSEAEALPIHVRADALAHVSATSKTFAPAGKSTGAGSNQSSRASFAFRIASSSVSPAEAQPGNSGKINVS